MVRLSVPPIEQVLFGEGGLGVQGARTGCWISGLEAREAQAWAGWGVAKDSLGCLHECVWGWACPSDIPKLF